MSVIKRSISATAAVTFLLIAVVCFQICSFSGCADNEKLIIKNQETGELYKSFKVNEGDIFSVEFIHSVNQSPVCDYFEIKNGKIYAVKTKYSAFGAGVQTEIGDGQTLSYDKEGNMIVSGFDLYFPTVKYIVGTVSDHVFELHGEKTSLRELCGKNAHIEFIMK